MSITFVVILMILAHIVADYNLQGWLASAKQKSWWEDNAPQKMYKYDYLMALFTHSLCWSIMIMIPIAIYCNFQVGFLFVSLVVCNTLIHGLIDNEKANNKTINLCEDQMCHLIQIVLTAIVYFTVNL